MSKSNDRYFTDDRIPEREIAGRRTWVRRSRYPHNACFGPVPSWYKRYIARVTRRREDRDIALYGEPGDWRKWGGGMIGWFY